MRRLVELLPWFRQVLATALLPAAVAAYPTAAADVTKLRVLDAFLVRGVVINVTTLRGW